MGQGRAQLYNIIASVFAVLTILAIVFFASKMAAPPPAPTQVAYAVPTVAILPSPTLTFTITPSDTSTFTLTPSATITDTITPTTTWTIIPTLTSSLTDTPIPSLTTVPSDTTTPVTPTQTSTAIPPSLTITDTLVVTPTDVPTFTPTTNSFTQEPTQPPPSPYPFILRDNQVIYTMNFANTAGCSWQGIGGQVFDLNGQPLTQMRVHVFGAGGVDLYAASGSNTLYGLSGWEIPLGTTLTGNSYIVELQSPGGTPISPQITVTFAPDCSKNLALVSFAQTRPF